MKPRALLASVSLTVFAGAAFAHDAAFPIGADVLRVEAPAGPSSASVRFETSGEAVLNTWFHDPGATGTWIVVQGVGAYGGHTGRIELDPSRWTATDEGYVYADEGGQAGGVTEVVLTSGGLRFTAAGERWPWSPAGPQDQVRVYFGMGGEMFCSELGGSVLSNLAGSFVAQGAGAPDACPEAVCGNGVREFGEACDDGNLVEDDGCTNTCRSGVCVGEEFDSTFEAIQQLVFDDRGCTNGLCHGSLPGEGELDLSADVAYDNLIDVRAAGSGYDRVEPRLPFESALWLKLLKAHDPEAAPIPGEPMPLLGPPIPSDLLEAVRRWIESGAPETGTVPLTASLLGGCFPDPVPIEVAPLAPPEPEEGVQLMLPPYPISAQTETEVCVATYYDLRGQIPEDALDPTGEYFFVSSGLIRSDPHSHHMIALHSGLYEDVVYHRSYGRWSCAGGGLDGSPCDPLDLDFCGEGVCAAAVRPNIVCLGYGPPGGQNGIDRSNDLTGPSGKTPGVFTRIPTHGIIYWNSHAFNLTDVELKLHSRRNFYFARAAERRREEERFQDIHVIGIAAGQPPYTIASYCAEHVFEPGTRVVSLSSHTHKRGDVFWINDPSGERIYETFFYGDPLTITYDPPLAFDSPDPKERTVEYCATFNNGVDRDGLPDPTTVRKLSETPPNALPAVFGLCRPVACAEGRVGAPCDGEDDDAVCDSFPGAGDGVCDACPITSGITTEDEMFVMLGSTLMAPEPRTELLALAGLLALGWLRGQRAAGKR